MVAGFAKMYSKDQFQAILKPQYLFSANSGVINFFISLSTYNVCPYELKKDENQRKPKPPFLPLWAEERNEQASFYCE